MDESTLALTDTLSSNTDPGEIEPVRPGTLVGRYVVLSKLGEGSMGEVFAAYDPELDRKVAIKLLAHRLGRHAAARARLLREAQALAKLEHPNVVTVHDVGEHEGQLFVGMEFVQGQTLQAWIDAVEQPRPWREVVRVLEAAGRGLAAAHAVGLVHRDFKPANVMIGSDGRVRVMDFGLVRTDDDAEPGETTEPHTGTTGPHDVLTQVGVVLGTPAYMPLEQFQSKGVDPRSDQFSFCVTLYEALYGERPFVGLGIVALMSAVSEARISEPPRGSKVPAWLRKVVVRGLSPSSEDRWPSMTALLDALTDDPARRHRRASMGVLLGAVMLGSASLIWTMLERPHSPCEGMEVHLVDVWDQTRRKQVRAAIEATQLSYAVDTWTRVEQELDAYAEAWVAARVDACEATHRGEQSGELLDLRMACLDERLTHLRATVELLAHADATIMPEVSKMVASLPTLERCTDVEALRSDQPPPEDPELAAEVERLDEFRIDALALEGAGKYVDALALADEIAEAAESLGHEPLLVRAWLAQAVLAERLGEYERAESLLGRAYELALSRRMLSEAAEAARQSMSIIGTKQIRFDEARQWAKHAGPLAQANTDEAVATFLYELSLLAVAEGKYAEAREHAERALAIRVEVLGDDHPHVAASLTNLGNVALQQGKFDEALAFHEQALALKQRTLGPDHPDVAASLNSLGNVALDQGDPELASGYHQRALAIRERAFGTNHPDVAASLNNLGNVAAEQGQIDAAFEYHSRSLAIKEAVLGPKHPHIATSLNNLGTIAAEQGKYDEARAYHERALEIRERALGPDHPEVATSLHNLGDLHYLQDQHELARDYFERALASFERGLGSEHPSLAHPLLGLGRVWLKLGDPGRAVVSLERADRMWSSSDDEIRRAHIHFELARALWDAPIDQGQDRARARALALSARDTLAAEDQFAGTVGKIDAWIASHELSGDAQRSLH
jgi:serine/threonine protein kinase/tetratricopeptide (TPR) repeat protein